MTPGWLRAAPICAGVASATTTPTFRNVAIRAMPVAATAALAAASVSPCTMTGTGAPVAAVSCRTSDADRGAKETDDAPVPVAEAAISAAATSRPVGEPRQQTTGGAGALFRPPEERT